MSRKALFPGTFDPFTLGHLDIVEQGLNLFDEIIVAVGVNSTKQTFFSPEQRTQWLSELFQDQPRVSVVEYDQLTAVFAKSVGAHYILRGLRTGQDFAYEKPIAHVNKDLVNDVQSVFVISNQKNESISSTIVRDLIRYRGDFKSYLPDLIHARILEVIDSK